MHLTYKIMEIVCDNCDKDGCECINCTIPSKIFELFELLDNYIIEERDDVEEARKRLLGDIPYLTNEKKKKFKELKGGATSEVDLNEIREHYKKERE